MIGEDRVRTDLSAEGGDEGGESRRKRVSKQAVRCNATGVYTATGMSVFVKNPSARLRCIVSVGFRADTGSSSSSATPGWTAAMDAQVKAGEQGGFYLASNGIIPGPSALSTAVPWSYEFNSMVDAVIISINVPNGPGSGAPPGYLWVTAAWEPTSDAIIGDGELQGLFTKCTLDVSGLLTVSTTGV